MTKHFARCDTFSALLHLKNALVGQSWVVTDTEQLSEDDDDSKLLTYTVTLRAPHCAPPVPVNETFMLAWSR